MGRPLEGWQANRQRQTVKGCLESLLIDLLKALVHLFIGGKAAAEQEAKTRKK